MKIGRFIALLFVLAVLLYGRDESPQSRRVVRNDIRHAEFGAEPFQLKKVASIDSASRDLVSKGMRSAGEFDVDESGNIYILSQKNVENFIYKFDKNGRYISSFARRGQGPGELEMPMRPDIVGGNRITVTDAYKKMVIFSTDGEFIREIKFTKHPFLTMELLANDKYLVFRTKGDPGTSRDVDYSLSILDPDFNEVRELDSVRVPAENSSLTPYFGWRKTDRYVYTVSQRRGYSFRVYDHEANLIRTIENESKPARVTDRIMSAILGDRYEDTLKLARDYFPNPMPAINSFFIDETGRIFAMTYKEGKADGAIYDIFGSDGRFLGQKAIPLKWDGFYFCPKYYTAKGGRLYGYNETKDGYIELVVYEIQWPR